MDVNKFFYYSALFSLLNAMNDYVACIRPLRGRVRLVTTWGLLPGRDKHGIRA